MIVWPQDFFWFAKKPARQVNAERISKFIPRFMGKVSPNLSSFDI